MVYANYMMLHKPLVLLPLSAVLGPAKRGMNTDAFHGPLPGREPTSSLVGNISLQIPAKSTSKLGRFAF